MAAEVTEPMVWIYAATVIDGAPSVVVERVDLRSLPPGVRWYPEEDAAIAGARRATVDADLPTPVKPHGCGVS